MEFCATLGWVIFPPCSGNPCLSDVKPWLASPVCLFVRPCWLENSARCLPSCYLWGLRLLLPTPRCACQPPYHTPGHTWCEGMLHTHTNTHTGAYMYTPSYLSLYHILTFSVSHTDTPSTFHRPENSVDWCNMPHNGNHVSVSHLSSVEMVSICHSGCSMLCLVCQHEPVGQSKYSLPPRSTCVWGQWRKQTISCFGGCVCVGALLSSLGLEDEVFMGLLLCC